MYVLSTRKDNIYIMLCRIIQAGFLPTNNIPVGNVVCGSLCSDVIYKLIITLKTEKLIFFANIKQVFNIFYVRVLESKFPSDPDCVRTHIFQTYTVKTHSVSFLLIWNLLYYPT